MLHLSTNTPSLHTLPPAEAANTRVVETAEKTTPWGPTYKLDNKDVYPILQNKWLANVSLGKSVTAKAAATARFSAGSSVPSHVPLPTSEKFAPFAIVGGMGPLATVDMFEKSFKTANETTRPGKDQEHMPYMAFNLSHMIGDRTAYLKKYTGDLNDKAALREHLLAKDPENPLWGSLAVCQAAIASGAHFLVFPCNTFHAWHEVLSEMLSVPCLHIAEAAMWSLKKGNEGRTEPLNIGIIATDGTKASKLYQNAGTKMEQFGCPKINWVEPDPVSQRDDVMSGIYDGIKAGNNRLGAERILAAELKLVQESGVEIHGFGEFCTEIPPARQNMTDEERASRGNVKDIDATQALVDLAITFSMSLKDVNNVLDARTQDALARQPGLVAAA